MLMKIYEQKIPKIHYFHYIEDMEYIPKEQRSGSRGKKIGERNNIFVLVRTVYYASPTSLKFFPKQIYLTKQIELIKKT